MQGKLKEEECSAIGGDIAQRCMFIRGVFSVLCSNVSVPRFGKEYVQSEPFCVFSERVVKI